MGPAGLNLNKLHEFAVLYLHNLQEELYRSGVVCFGLQPNTWALATDPQLLKLVK